MEGVQFTIRSFPIPDNLASNYHHGSFYSNSYVVFEHGPPSAILVYFSSCKTNNIQILQQIDVKM